PGSQVLFTDNETNNERIFGTPNLGRYVKDAFHEYLIRGRTEAINPENAGTKAALVRRVRVDAGGVAVLRLRLSRSSPDQDPFAGFDAVFETRRAEADAFYRTLIPASAGEDAGHVMRQALSGMLWGKQYYLFDANRWLEEHGASPFMPSP